jgi:apolipoprotein N-acyltransferase
VISGFPWALLAFSQTNSPLAGYIPWLGQLGVSWLVCLEAGLLVEICKWTEAKQLITLIFFLGILFCGFYLNQIAWSQAMPGSALTISAVQAAVPQELKWVPEHFERNLQTYNTLTKPVIHSDLIIWPEAAITLPMQNVSDYLFMWHSRLKENGAALLLGLPIQTDADTYYNGLIVIGAHQGEYRKRHLVPFGEYPFLYPLSKYIMQYFHIPMSTFTPGLKHQALIQLGNISLATYICYEVAYESLVLSDFDKANLIINISDDSWFGHSLAAWQQLQIGQFRAIETARYAVFGTNDGITAMVDPKGKILAKLPRYQQNVLTEKLTAMQGKTPMMSLGNTGVLLGLIGLLLIMLCAQIYCHRIEGT